MDAQKLLGKRLSQGGKSDRAASLQVPSGLQYGIVQAVPTAATPKASILLAGAVTPVLLPSLLTAPLASQDVVLISGVGNDLVVVGLVSQAPTTRDPLMWADASVADIPGVGNASSTTGAGAALTPSMSGTLLMIASCAADSAGAAAYQGYKIEPTLDGVIAPTSLGAAPQAVQPVTGVGGQNAPTVVGFGLFSVNAGVQHTMGVKVTTGGGGATNSTFFNICLIAVLGARGS